MINLKHIKEAIRLLPDCLESAQAYSDWQYAVYCAEQELEKFKQQPAPPPEYKYPVLTLEQYEKELKRKTINP